MLCLNIWNCYRNRFACSTEETCTQGFHSIQTYQKILKKCFLIKGNSKWTTCIEVITIFPLLWRVYHQLHLIPSTIMVLHKDIWLTCIKTQNKYGIIINKFNGIIKILITNMRVDRKSMSEMFAELFWFFLKEHVYACSDFLIDLEVLTKFQSPIGDLNKRWITYVTYNVLETFLCVLIEYVFEYPSLSDLLQLIFSYQCYHWSHDRRRSKQYVNKKGIQISIFINFFTL